MTFQRYSDARSENWDRWLWSIQWIAGKGTEEALSFFPSKHTVFVSFFLYICISSKKTGLLPWYYDTMWVCVKIEYPQKKWWLRTSGFLGFPIEMASFGGIPPKNLGTHTFPVRLPIRLVNWGVHPTWWVIYMGCMYGNICSYILWHIYKHSIIEYIIDGYVYEYIYICI